MKTITLPDMDLRITPLTINEFKTKYSYEKSTLGYLIANYAEYLNQNTAIHHYEQFLLKSEWLAQEIDAFAMEL